MDTLKKFIVKEFYRGRDAFWLDNKTRSYTLLCDAISDAEKSWDSGQFEKVSVAEHCGHEPSIPCLAWLRQRNKDPNWRNIFDKGHGPKLFVPELPGVGDFEFLFKITANEYHVNSNHPFLEHTEFLKGPENNMQQVLEEVWDFTWKMYALLGLHCRIYFDGLTVENYRVTILLREEEGT